MRLRMIALGKSTPDEIFLMVVRENARMEEAKAILARAGNPSLVIENYQKIVAANVRDCQVLRPSDRFRLMVLRFSMK
jgi:hypothetical protein